MNILRQQKRPANHFKNPMLCLDDMARVSTVRCENCPKTNKMRLLLNSLSDCFLGILLNEKWQHYELNCLKLLQFLNFMISAVEMFEKYGCFLIIKSTINRTPFEQVMCLALGIRTNKSRDVIRKMVNWVADCNLQRTNIMTMYLN